MNGDPRLYISSTLPGIPSQYETQVTAPSSVSFQRANISAVSLILWSIGISFLTGSSFMISVTQSSILFIMDNIKTPLQSIIYYSLYKDNIVLVHKYFDEKFS